MTETPKGPVLIDLDEDAGPAPADAPPVAEAGDAPSGQAMQTMAGLMASRPSALSRWFWRLLGAIAMFALSIAAWDFVTGLVTRNAVLGYVAIGLLGLFLLVCLGIAVREAAALARLGRISTLRSAATEARDAGDLKAAQETTDRLVRLYRGRDGLGWGLAAFDEQKGGVLDAETLLDLAEAHLMTPLDGAARAEVEAAARQVAAVTAVVPLALADVIAALTSNLRMIRRIAAIYGGRSGRLETWRLTRAVFAHLVATGAMAVGDDLIGSVAGGGILSRVSRRFGEGVINGALTARVGVAAMEVSRPLPFHAVDKPSVTSIIRRALTGLFGTKSRDD